MLGMKETSVPCPKTRCAYPFSGPRSEVDAYDLHRYLGDLDSRAADLFVDDEAGCRVELRQHAPRKLSRHNEHVQPARERSSGTCEEGRLAMPVLLPTAECLSSSLEMELPPGATRFFTIQRSNSWSRMEITSYMFHLLCSASKVTPRIIDLVRGMRYKSAPGDEHFISCFYDIRGPSNSPERTRNESFSAPKSGLEFQVCYNLRHFEKHGRDLKDPWSCRQSVVHQRYEFTNSLSTWIIIQPSTRWQATLDDVDMDGITHPLSLHLRSLSSAVANNWEYLEYLSAELLSLDKRAAFPKPLAKFEVDFTLSQKVHSIRKRLHHVKTILNGTLGNVGALLLLADEIQTFGSISQPAHDAFKGELGNISRELEAYKLTTDELLSHSSDLKSTINSILEFRNQEILTNNSVSLQRLAEDNARETLVMADISKRTYKDSRTMRIATVIALIYLPASLILSFFSTVFVHVSQDVGANIGASGGTHLVIYDPIWVAIVSMVVLSTGTCFSFWYWDHKRQKSPPPSIC